jgi:hypothetical protein
MENLIRKATMLMMGLVGLSSLAAISTFTLTANNLAGLRDLEIRAFGDFAIDPEEKILLTAEGDYLTYTVPLRSHWSIVSGEDYGWLVGGCDGQKTCEFQANHVGGDVVIRAEANGFTDDRTIHIRKPTPPKAVQNPFTDEIPTWAGEPIVELKDRNIIRGYDDGRYGAGDKLTRGQLVTIFHRALRNMNLTQDLNCPIEYNDIPRGHYAYEAACTFRNRGWTDSLTTLEPNEPVTRAETASLLNRVIGGPLLSAKDLRLGKVIAEGQVFSDVTLSNQFFVDTAVVRSLGIMKGNPDKTFGLDTTLNRAEAATIFFRLMDSIEEAGMRSV